MATANTTIEEVAPLLGKAGAAFYFTPETVARGKELGLDGFRFYFLGRGGVLGDVEAPVIASAFGYFEPALLARMWNTARAVVAPRTAAREHLACAHAMARDRLDGLPGLGAFCVSAERVVAAADPTGLALFAGMLGEPLPADAPARALHLAVQLRELRGSAHLLAVRASGLSPMVAHYLRRPDDFRVFGWSESDVPAVGDAERTQLAAADALTDALLQPAFDVLDTGGRAALVEGARAMAHGLVSHG